MPTSMILEISLNKVTVLKVELKSMNSDIGMNRRAFLASYSMCVLQILCLLEYQPVSLASPYLQTAQRNVSGPLSSNILFFCAFR